MITSAIRISLVVVILLPHHLIFAQPKTQSVTLSAAKIERIDAAVRAWMLEKKAPSIAVSIVRGNTPVLEKAYGLSDIENNVPATAQTVYRLASISKTVTAIAVMQLVEKGKIELGAPINKYCPIYPEKQSYGDDPKVQSSITVRQLLIHQSGVRHNRPDELLTTKHYRTINDAVTVFKDDSLVVEPESRFHYSTPGYTLLGCAIEGAAGMPYFDYIRENILKPAKMSRTYVDEVTALIPDRARFYQRVFNGDIRNAPLHDTSIKVPGGGLAMSVQDLAKLAIAINTNRLVRAETANLMWTKPKTRDGRELSYAMGVMVGGEGDQLSVFSDGSQPGARTYLYMLPRRQIAIAMMTNLQNAFCEEMIPAILEILAENSSSNP